MGKINLKLKMGQISILIQDARNGMQHTLIIFSEKSSEWLQVHMN